MNQNNIHIPEILQIIIGVILFAALIYFVTPTEVTQNYDYPGTCLSINC